MIGSDLKRGSNYDLIDHDVRFVGGSAAVTKVADTGRGMTVTYISTGVVELTWADNPGTFHTCTFGLQATTPGNVKAYVPVAGAYNATTFKLRLYLYESGSLADLDALEWLSVRATFKLAGAPG